MRSTESGSSRRRRALGQHYLVDGEVVDLMVRTAAIQEGERVLEVGTGRGVVTRELCRVASSVEAFEVDRANYQATERLNLSGLALFAEDAFAEPRRFDVLVSSLPYSESSSFLEWLAKLRYRRAVVLLQRDFAEKLLVRPGDERYRAVSVISQISSQLEIVCGVDRDSFDPPPRVSSVLVRISYRRQLSQEQVRLIKLLFSQRRRKLGSALRNLELRLLDAGLTELSRRVGQSSADEIEKLLPRIAPVQTLSRQHGPG